MTADALRAKYLAFFKAKPRRHAEIPSASLVPENDPTTLFTGSGMQPLVPYLLGEPHPAGTRLVNVQKCFRSEDIEAVGDNRHTTFFEMLGNWSLGDYGKEEQLAWCIEFLAEELGIPKVRLWATCFEGDERFGLPRDTESAELWRKLGISAERIRFYGAEKNWWSRAGVPEQMPAGEPGGPDSEVFFEFAEVPHNRRFGEKCHPNCDCGRFMEIGNSVFMEYRKTGGGFEKLPRRNVDFGGGLERITAAANNEPNIFKLDVFLPAVDALEQLAGKTCTGNESAFRIILDHLRAVVFLIGDGITPSNAGQGYFVRRLLRRALYYFRKLNENRVPALLARPIIEEYGKYYTNLPAKAKEIDLQITNEEVRFRATVEYGIKVFEKVVQGGEGRCLSGRDAFILFSTYGLPAEIIREMAKEKGVAIDETGLQLEMERHREISRDGAERKFKGGLADASEMSVKYHTATHLLHQALRDVLSHEVRQRGSNITPERLRFDFAFPRKLTDGELRRLEETVNAKIREDLPVRKVILPLKEAKASGALHFFDEKYPEDVLVHYIGDTIAGAYSREFCGGPHAARTGVLGSFAIMKEEAVSAGVRRIKAVLR